MKIGAKTTFVLKSALLTILGCVILMGSSFFALSLFMPRFVADASYDLGFQGIALHYYEVTYNRTNDIDDLYNALIVSIFTQNDNKTVELYETLQAQEGYADLMAELDEETLASSQSVLQKSLLWKEDNYLKNNYVKALLNQSEVYKAIQFAKQHTDLDLIEDSENQLYLFQHIFSEAFVQQELVAQFANEEYEENVTYFEKITTYFESANNRLDMIMADDFEGQEVQLTFLARKLIVIADNIVAANAVAEVQADLPTIITIRNDLASKIVLLTE